MAAGEAIEPGDGREDAAASRAHPGRTAAKWIFGGLAAAVLLIVAALALLNSPIGQRWVTDQIAKVAPASGLKISIGRIEGNLYGKATLHDVTLSDPTGPFLTVPLVDLDWRPTSWFARGLDVRELTTHRGTLLRLPELNPGDPDAPILPNFDIRIDKLAIDDLTIAKGVIDAEAHKVNLRANADIRDGRVLVKADGRLGTRDRIHALVDAEPDGDRFDIDLDYRAPRGGVIAGLIGAEAGYSAKVRGEGTWSRWNGVGQVLRDGENFAAFRMTNAGGDYTVVGQAHPRPAIPAGLLRDALGETVSYKATGTLNDSVLDGTIRLVAGGVAGTATGALDLGNNAAEGLAVNARIRNPALLGAGTRVEGARIGATLDGPFRDLTIDHRLSVAKFASGATEVTGLTQRGTATYDGARWTLPVDAKVARIVTGSAQIDPRLVDGTMRGTVTYQGNRIASEGLALAFPGASARLTLAGDTASGDYRVAGPVTANGLAIENVGTVNGGATIVATFGSSPWTLQADFRGSIPKVSNETLANLAGPSIAFSGGITTGGARPLDFRGVRIDAAKLDLSLDGMIRPGRTSVAGRGRHVDYGPFTVEGAYTDRGPEAVLVFADPLPAAGLKDVRVAIVPTDDGFGMETRGDSMLGRFEGQIDLFAPSDGPTRLAIRKLDVWKTSVTGELTVADGAAAGTLAVAGGGLDGTIALSPRGGGQAFDVELAARDARFAGATPLSIGRADIDASGLLVDGNSTIGGSVYAQGVTYGSLFIGRLAARADLENGAGTVTASVAGRRGSRFAMQLNANVAPRRIAVAARGEFAGRAITMPRRAVLLKQPDGGWLLEPAQVNFAGGGLIGSGELGGGRTAMKLQMADLPLSVVDIFTELGLGGRISGVIDFASGGGAPLTGAARIKVDGLTRSGLVLTSRPMDLAMVLRLTPERLETRAVMDEGGQRRGRLQGRVADLPQDGALFDRLRAGNLFAQLRYKGPADALWRLAAVDAFDLTGPLSVAADVNGSLAAPLVRGVVASDNLRLRSSLSGTDLANVKARGTFSGSRLRLTGFSGTSPNGGSVSGSGVITLEDLGVKGPQLDIRVAARNARLLDAQGLSATVTGPLRIVSDGIGGTIAGRLLVDRASWRLGTAAADVRLPQIRTREINLPYDAGPPRVAARPWRYLIDARAPSRVDVDGMGLDSEWGANVVVRGTTDDPRIGGEARMVRGDYTFAGTRFELTRGVIRFDENVPIDPRLDIVAESESQGIDVAVKVQGSALQPEITFQSTPALPEEEILARLLFGGSITELSATDVLQLGSALASLRGGGGMDPINRLRSAIGLDRLRIVSADPALGRATSIALGKNIGRRFYVEIVTDGRGYSATQAEFRITSWLSILGSISTIGRESIVAEVSRDY
ncbi:translocation/assembly module TamB domain-containing protein [Tsuneonella sp. YG55]|uniref:Translocation/assembly module TamB domain-containing protein n=1 Tax=Tsuneonella litorea TaxID=2976475 RepID=A0A9X2W3T9_9SPHN|nr:translocation/assembly module TamB domain-containing protein [Tsuneonella litorea]MCT2560128.1 translocation/assembly module TamB domain-containing protein [Tsuneonella litorea]